MKVLLTGAAGFIGFHVAQALLAQGAQIVGLDNLNPYYDVRLKEARLARLSECSAFSFHRADVADSVALHAIAAAQPDVEVVLHLAAQAGVRHSLHDPFSYVQSNVMGHLVMLEAARRLPRLRHFVYASSSSVYGANRSVPFAETDRVDNPVSLYAATKRSGELISETYARLFGLPQTGLRFFTVYGPWGRPDMAYYSFARAIVAGEPITLYDGGRPRRDFTYIDDIVAGVLACIDLPPSGEVPARVLNIGNHQSESVLTLVHLLEAALKQRAIVQTAPLPIADVQETLADIRAIQELAGFAPITPLAVGIPRFGAWFREWHGMAAPAAEEKPVDRREMPA